MVFVNVMLSEAAGDAIVDNFARHAKAAFWAILAGLHKRPAMH